MTRGTLFFIEKLKNRKIRITRSCEFNGDMYEKEHGGHGGEVMELLKKSDSRTSFIKNVNEFDSKNFKYQDEGSAYYKFYTEFIKDEAEYPIKKQGNLIWVDFRKDYFKWFFSDWTFWKNNTEDCEVQFFTFEYIGNLNETTTGEIIKLKPKECIAINFGQYKNHYK